MLHILQSADRPFFRTPYGTAAWTRFCFLERTLDRSYLQYTGRKGAALFGTVRSTLRFQTTLTLICFVAVWQQSETKYLGALVLETLLCSENARIL